MNIYSIASGSSGNCIYTGTKESGILIDVGISMRRIKEGLEAQNLSLYDIKAILITHEHSDHISGLGPVLRKVPIPVYATSDTIEAIWEKGNMSNIDPKLFHSIKAKTEIEIANYLIKPFSIPHDAKDPVCYTIEDNYKKVGVATDMGCYNDEIIKNLGDCDSLLLESNHDINMLQVGPYPYKLKMRILGNRGHLSNDTSAKLIRELIHSDLQHIQLGHLSGKNNYPDLAYKTVLYDLEEDELWKRYNIDLSVANREKPSPLKVIK